MTQRSFLLAITLCISFINNLKALDINGNIQVNGVTRTFIIHSPGTCVATNLPTVLVFHGDGGTASGIKGYSGFDAAADNNDFLVVYAQSTNDLGNGIWNKPVDGDETGEPQDVAFVSQLIDYLCTNYGINKKQVYATGHSGGAFFSYRLGVELADKIAGIAPVAGNMYGDNNYLTTYSQNSFVPVPVWHIHGDADGTVAYPDSDFTPTAWNEWPLSFFSAPASACGANTYNASNVSTIVSGVQKYPFCTSGKEVSIIRIVGGGHGWPAVNGFNAATAIWNFFKDYQLANLASCQPGPGNCTTGIGSGNVSREDWITIYPNPVKETVILQFHIPLISIQLTDLSGKLITEKQVNGATETQLQLTNLPSGIYILKSIDKSGNFAIHKLVVEN